jgi:hypothetical protein
MRQAVQTGRRQVVAVQEVALALADSQGSLVHR